MNCLKVLISKILFLISIRGGFKGYFDGNNRVRSNQISGKL